MKNNMTILEKNITDSLFTKLAIEEFLWAARRHDRDRYLYIAENHARQVDKIVVLNLPFLWLAAHGHGLMEIPPGLVEFIVRRLRYKNFGGGE